MKGNQMNIDMYSYMTDGEFLRQHGNRIPDDLLPRIEEVFERAAEYNAPDEAEE